eukprot:560094_1
MEWTQIWFDDGTTQGSWICEDPGGDGGCTFGRTETSLHQCHDAGGQCHRVTDAYLERSNSITAYAGLPLRLSVYVDASGHQDDNDWCGIFFAYDNDAYNSIPDWDCGDAARVGPISCEWDENGGVDGVVTVDIPSSTGRTTLWIALEALTTTNEYCNFDTVSLLYLPPPTSAPSKAPTKGMTPNPTKRITPNPTENPSKQPTSKPTQSPTVKPTSNPTPNPTNPVDIAACGDTVSGAYNGEPVTITMSLPVSFDFGDVHLDAGASTFVVTDIEATTKSGVSLGIDEDHDEQITLTNLPAGEYKFILDGAGTQSGTFKAQIQCFARSTTSPTTNPIATTSNQADPTPAPVTVASTTTTTTADPTETPTHVPSTATPTSNPTINPTTASPTQPGEIACGKDSVGTYSSGPLTFDTSMPLPGSLTFDASGCTFVITTIDVFMGSVFIGTYSDHDGVVTLATAVAGDYTFVVTGETSGFYYAKVRCVTNTPTQYPTHAPIKDPTETPIYTPSHHPITTRPSSSPFTLSPTTDGPTSVAPTVSPTVSPTERTISSTSSELASTIESRTDNKDNTDSTALQTAVYISLSLIVFYVLGCVAFAYYKYHNIHVMIEDIERVTSISSNTIHLPVPQLQTRDDLVISWLQYTVKLPQYEDHLFSHGYDNMQKIQLITSREELRTAGITVAGHVALMMAEIEALRGIDFGTSSCVIRGEADHKGTVDLLPLPVESEPVPSDSNRTGINHEDSSDSDDDLFGDMDNNIGLRTRGPTDGGALGAEQPGSSVNVAPVHNNKDITAP